MSLLGWLALALLTVWLGLRVLLFLIRRMTRRKYRNYVAPIQHYRQRYCGYDYEMMIRGKRRAEAHERERRHLAALRSRPQ